jgi:hypothetical protein
MRSDRGRRSSGSRAWARALTVLVVVVMLTASALPMSALARPGRSSGLVRIDSFSLEGPIGPMLSASSW